ncbi:hypothetical protein F4677DRAFT_137667 [Hypoxylon crocopeplum]|nr:hypothetical protein F4677DRAFT_137667 [Hypoxylon crocopeplum]
MAYYNNIMRAIAILTVAAGVNAHSWVEQVRRIDSSGAFTGEVGYPIGYVNRTGPHFIDGLAQNRILDTKSNPVVCKPKANAYATHNRLAAAPGDYVALVYQENGHVTQPYITPRPYRDGIVNVYGTMHHEDSDGINDVLNSWTADGKGGNGKGQLLGTHYYDDGQCYQNLGLNFAIPIYAERYHEHGLNELFCQTDFQLPEDLPTNGTYTVMWVWDWPLITSDTQNTTEIYTSCAEIELQEPQAGKNAKLKYSSKNAINKAGIASQLETQFEATGLGIGTHPPTAPTATPSEDSTTTDKASATETSSDPTRSTTKHHKGDVKTVTVTAEPETTTAWKTIIVGGAGGAEQSATSAGVTSTVAQSTTTSTDVAVPTSNVPVVSVSKFLRARATGQVRRGGSDQS